jgi:hypothetical protein
MPYEFLAIFKSGKWSRFFGPTGDCITPGAFSGGNAVIFKKILLIDFLDTYP